MNTVIADVVSNTVVTTQAVGIGHEIIALLLTIAGILGAHLTAKVYELIDKKIDKWLGNKPDNTQPPAEQPK